MAFELAANLSAVYHNRARGCNVEGRLAVLSLEVTAALAPISSTIPEKLVYNKEF